MADILDFKTKYKEKKEAEKVHKISLEIATFCEANNMNPEEFLNDCSDMAEEGKLMGVKCPKLGEVIFGFTKIGETTQFFTSEEYADLSEDEPDSQ